jgi:hypothetical protein
MEHEMKHPLIDHEAIVQCAKEAGVDPISVSACWR